MQIVRRPLAPGETNHELLWLGVSSGGLALAATWLALKLPWPICLFHSLTGHPCLTCGATRSAVAFFHAHFFAAFQWNPLAFLFYSALSIFNLYALAVIVMQTPPVRIAKLTASERNIFRRPSQQLRFAGHAAHRFPHPPVSRRNGRNTIARSDVRRSPRLHAR